MKKKIIFTIGTRPEAIKIAPIINSFKNENWTSISILLTAQHRSLLDQIVSYFKIQPDIDLNIMQKNQSLASLSSKLFSKIDLVLKKESPDLVIAQGDTTTVMIVAMCCFYNQIKFAHVEAGLRTGNLKNPFPEEFNRIVASKIASLHFAPTETSKHNLLKEGVNPKSIFVTGNTVIDALFIKPSKKINLISYKLDSKKRLILVTCHRRENFDKSFKDVCKALIKLAKTNQNIQIIFPVHPNPNIKKPAYKLLSKIQGITLCDPLDYPVFIELMKRSYLIITDSGGVQEEAPALGKPVLVIRDETERPEAVLMGVVKIIGTEYKNIVKETQLLLDDQKIYKKMARGASPYGDGKASQRIVKITKKFLNA